MSDIFAFGLHSEKGKKTGRTKEGVQTKSGISLPSSLPPFCLTLTTRTLLETVSEIAEAENPITAFRHNFILKSSVLGRASCM